MKFRTTNISIRVFAAVVLLTLFWQTESVLAQAKQARKANASIDREMKKIRIIQERRLATTIEELHRVCELSDDQMLRLKVAAKGAIEKSIEQTRKQFVFTINDFGIEIPGLDNPEEEEPNDDTVEDPTEVDDEFIDEDIDANMLEHIRWVILEQQQGYGESRFPEKQSFWTTAVKNTLTDDQAKKYSIVIAERQARSRKAAVEVFVTRVDNELLLSVVQREQLLKLVDETYGDVLGKNLDRKAEDSDAVIVRGDGNSRINRDVSKLLSAGQYDVWKSRFANHLELVADRNGQPKVQRRAGLLETLFGR